MAQAREDLAEKQRQLKIAYEQIADRDRDLAALRFAVREAEDRISGLTPENIIWIFCTGRSGSTWLGSMMGDVEGHDMWNEPLVGQLFGEFYYIRAKHKRGDKFIMGSPHKNVWLKSIRSMVLEGAIIRYPEFTLQDYLVIKEPHGSIGAPLLMEAIPESRMVFLIRDPRDVVASAMDAQRKDSWTSEHAKGKKAEETLADTDPDVYAKVRAVAYSRHIGNSKQAYEAHTGPKTLVRYEDLRADTLGTMERIYKELGIEVEETELARVVQKHSWENIPEDQKGQGKFYRKASPGGWREDLTQEQVRVVEKTTAPLLSEFYPE